MERGQAVQENGIRSGQVHDSLCHLIWSQLLNPLLPYLVRLTHGYPHIRINDIRSLNRFRHMLCESNGTAAGRRIGLAFLDQRWIREILSRSTGHEMHAHLCAGNHQGVTHIITRISHIHKL